MNAPLDLSWAALVCMLPLASLVVVAVVGLVVYLSARLRDVRVRLGELEQRVRHLESGGQGPSGPSLPDQPRQPKTSGIREPLR